MSQILCQLKVQALSCLHVLTLNQLPLVTLVYAYISNKYPLPEHDPVSSSTYSQKHLDLIVKHDMCACACVFIVH